MDREAMIMILKDAISNVLETMFYATVQFPHIQCDLNEWFPHDQFLLGATLDFHGPKSGSLFLWVSSMVANDMTANFLGVTEEKINEELKWDTV